MINVGFAKITGNGIVPTRNTEDDAGFDFYAIEDYLIAPNSSAIIKTDICWCPVGIDPRMNVYMQMKGRSGLAFKSGIECTNAGVIDAGYRGDIEIKLYNTNNNESFKINKGDKIAQGIIHIIPRVSSFEIDYKNVDLETERGNLGFGSSDIKDN